MYVLAICLHGSPVQLDSYESKARFHPCRDPGRPGVTDRGGGTASLCCPFFAGGGGGHTRRHTPTQAPSHSSVLSVLSIAFYVQSALYVFCTASFLKCSTKNK
ncbi:UNVERIFIED_CONTAM: hypothetical protein K2H54_062569 [Gekko kuhli]